MRVVRVCVCVCVCVCAVMKNRVRLEHFAADCSML